MPVVTAAVMATRRPDSRLPHILDRLRPLNPQVIHDRGNPWKTARAAWGAVAPRATHHLVVQDDIRIAPGLPDAVVSLATSLPEVGFAFYAQWDTNCAYRVRMAAFGGDHLVEASARDWVPAQALLLPRHLCEAIAAMPEDADRDDDEVLAALLYRSELRCPVAISVPNLVEHDDDPMLGYNHEDGLRRATCFLPDRATWPRRTDLPADGPGWREVSVVLAAGGARLDWGILVPEQPRRLRHIHIPWRLGVPHAGLDPETVVGVGKQVLSEVDWRGAAGALPDESTAAAAVAEFVAAAVLHGVAWRHWWRGGRPAAALRADAPADTALLSLWRCGRLPDVPQEVVTALGHRALHAGAELDGVSDLEEFHSRLTVWFHANKSSLPRSMWANSERE